MQTTRRNFLSSLAMGSCCALNLPLLASAAKTPSNTPTTGKRIKNVIMLVSDGLGMGALSACNYLQQQLYKHNSQWQDLYNNSDLPLRRYWQHTRSANALVTDSAAAASSWGCGKRVNNGQLNVLPDGSRPATLAAKFKAAGKSVALLTSCEFTHATPAGFAVHADSRNQSGEIAEQYLDCGIDVLMGGGAAILKQQPELAAAYAKKYQVISAAHQLDNIDTGRPLLALFADSHLPYALDRANDKKIPGLVRQLDVALQLASRNPKGFFLLCEAGRVDHAGHANDACSLFHEQREFNQCIATALEFYRKHPEDTLLVITSDHGTGGLQIDGMGSDYLQTDRLILNMSCAKNSFEFCAKNARNPQQFMQMLQTAHPCENFIQALQKYTAQELVDAQGLAKGHFNAALLGAIGKQAYGLGWSTTTHCAEAVELLLIGNAQAPSGLEMENYQLHELLLQAI